MKIYHELSHYVNESIWSQIPFWKQIQEFNIENGQRDGNLQLILEE
jgi:hypothetical protein